MVFKRRKTDSDDEFLPTPPKVRRKQQKLRAQTRNESSPSMAAGPSRFTPERPSTPQADDNPPPLPSIESLLGILQPSVPSASNRTPVTPYSPNISMAAPLSSPMSSVIDETPIKDPRGRPAYTPETRKLSTVVRRLEGSQITPDRVAYQEALAQLTEKKEHAVADRAFAAEQKRLMEAEEQAKQAADLRRARDAECTIKAQQVLADVLKPAEDGGYNFVDLEEFFQGVFRPGGDRNASLNISRYVGAHGAELARTMFARSDSAREDYISTELAEIYRHEGRAIQNILTRNSTTSVINLLKEFSMDQLAAELEMAAPWLWRAMVVIAEPDKSTRSERDGESRKHKGLVCISPSNNPLRVSQATQVFTTICALISVLRSQKANNFQLVIGLFLLGSGASKREIEVLAHAGLSISYSSIIGHVKSLSEEGMGRVRQLIKESMCQIVWDNLNIAFRVASERLQAKSHFDNGTTVTAIPLFDPATGGNARHGTLPFSMKPPRERTLPVIDWTAEDTLPSPQSAEELSALCFWQMQRLALEHVPGANTKLKEDFEDCPEIFQIPLHKTEQYPLPAMHIDESTLEGTQEVYETILRQLGLDDDALEAHGLLFDDGDLLTDSLKEKIESARRNSTTPIASMRASVRRWGLFHAEMAGGRLTVNEHWGKANSLFPGGLWWEHNKLLKRKPITAGWSGKKATPWKPAHELLHISLPAHIVDGFRIYCGQDNVENWAKTATITEFKRVARNVFDKLFSTPAVDGLREGDPDKRDITLENTILYNRDALFYIEFVQAIKKGDVGRVLNVLSIWMVMMRSPKTMPRYADAIFETLVRLKHFPPKLRELFLVNWLVNLTGRALGFKPVDLLQEHQNFWAKIIYTAKGTNKSWEWLSMITVCIFTLRDAMRTVQTAFDIPAYGEKHKTPPIKDEVALLASALQAEKIQTFVQARPANEHVSPVRDLIREGALYGNGRKAFKRFTRDTRKAEKRGYTEVGGRGRPEEEEDSESEVQEDYEPTEEDLRADDEEFFDMTEPGELFSHAAAMVDDILH
ncbi:hypothetical protein R3P38DRAFT_3266396 [Favolaschia claudopus]|uniref:DUF6589 domain-containing protein n=1 Tax=Favolaschia claudopus TaxID=2862362 RepID=A0AAW0BVG0_9AGAR